MTIKPLFAVGDILEPVEGFEGGGSIEGATIIRIDRSQETYDLRLADGSEETNYWGFNYLHSAYKKKEGSSAA